MAENTNEQKKGDVEGIELERRVMFRAWDIEHKVMIYQEDDLVINRVTKIMAYKSNHAKFIFQQFIGLLDKNGKCIYEGDIVKNKFGRIGIVSYGHDGRMERWTGFWWKPIDSPCHWAIPYNKSEVIGNIFENPELIEDIKSGT